MAIKCKHCEVEKSEDQMKVRAGKPSKVCIECSENRTGLGAGAPKKKRAKRAKSVEPNEIRLTMPGGGYGFDAFVTGDDQLQISQENAGTETDNVVLSKAEARMLFEKFEAWAGE